MGLKEICLAAFLSNNVLTDDGKPVGNEVISKAEITVSLLHSNSKEQKVLELPAEYINPDLEAYLEFTKRTEFLDSSYRFPDDIENIVKNSFKTWTDAEINFVPLSEAPDFQIFAFFGKTLDPKGFASFPQNDLGQPYYGGESLIIAIDTFKAENPDFYGQRVLGGDYRSAQSGKPLNEIIEGVLTHEIGHTLGIRHPEQILDYTLKHRPECQPFATEIKEDFTHGFMSEHAYAHEEHVHSPYEEDAFKRLSGLPTQKP